MRKINNEIVSDLITFSTQPDDVSLKIGVNRQVNSTGNLAANNIGDVEGHQDDTLFIGVNHSNM